MAVPENSGSATRDSVLVGGDVFGSLFSNFFSSRKKAARLNLISKLMKARGENFPLRKRSLLNRQEYEIFQLVKHVYEGQDVLVKTSLTRMVVSTDKEKRQDLFECIENLVFLFVVMDADTNVVACIDFYNFNSKKRKDVRLKACIMASLGIDYWVLGNDYLEDLKKIQEKFEFLKFSMDEYGNPVNQADKDDFTQVKKQLHERLKDRRNEAKAFSDSSTIGSGFSTSTNSFLLPLDER
ncbi:DUF2726 domain-containing protein [Rhodoferax aquaticus]|uniref:DUF2726 domain-containing protein n=1 Tax=Rhodoferax aquaticus TaxID=2527691 RepID=A0A515EQ51_9BURK|nr:DUF2726 domain-containing protein [Rhodoferax aquaticus]QDL54776.1 DUF2726 domain-containing protein [Rhodoferax aquaticus]